MEEKRKFYSILVGRPEGKRLFGRPRCCRDRRDFREVGVCDKNSPELVQNRILWRTFVTAAIIVITTSVYSGRWKNGGHRGYKETDLAWFPWLESRRGRDHWEDRDVVGRTILEGILEK